MTAAAATTNAPAATTATTAGNGNGNGQRSTVLKISPNKTANGNTIVSPGAVHQVNNALQPLAFLTLQTLSFLSI